jgi:hypothetical protein
MIGAIRACLLAGGFSLVLVGAPGCSGKRLAFADKVEGTLTLDGRPLANAQVQFVPDEGSAPVSRAVTNDKGRFALVCDDKARPGAVVGWHRVVVYPGRPEGARGREENAPEEEMAPVRVPSVYLNVASTPLKVEVTPSQTTYDLPLSSAPPAP